MKILVAAAAGVLLTTSLPASAAAPELSGAAVYAGASDNQLSRYDGGEWSTIAKPGSMPQYAASPTAGRRPG
ncbi:hypothetical protein ACFQ0B_09385 [Nonomuraea thailandensis]